jgi:futalosine hydrolase
MPWTHPAGSGLFSEFRIMKIAILSATARETEPVRQYLNERIHLRKKHQFSFWTTGVGLMHTTYELTCHLRTEKPDLLIQTGICGGFHPLQHPIGSAVAVKEELVGDMGAMEPDGSWRDIFDLRLSDPFGSPYAEKCLSNPHIKLLMACGMPSVRGISVNQVTTDPQMVLKLSASYAPDVESMEGAAFHYVCLKEGIPFVQLRGISNLIGDRDKSRWQMREALESVQNSLNRLLDKIVESDLI